MVSREFPHSNAGSAPGTVATFGDLALVVLLSLLTVGLALGEAASGPLEVARVPLGFLFVFVFPGYALTSVLFPRADGGRGGYRTVSPAERLVLSVGLSLTAVPLTALFWNFTAAGIGLEQVLGSVALVTVVAAVAGAYRRYSVPPFHRFSLVYSELGRTNRRPMTELLRTGSVSSIVLATLVVLSVAGLGVTLGTSGQGEAYTEFYLLDENETGALVADDYPTQLTRDESTTVHVGITNHEATATTYTVVVELHRVSTGEQRAVAAVTELDRFSVSLAPNESYRRPHTVTPQTTGQNLRLTYLLYRGDPPAEPTTRNAYREVHLWVDVTE